MKRKFLFKLLIFLLIGAFFLQIFMYPLSLAGRYPRNDYQWLKESVVLSSMNWRDKEYDPDNKEGHYRIIILGGSYTFGWYINDVNKTFPRLLDNNLKEKFPNYQFDVINASRHGFSVAEQIDRLKNEGIWFHPNLVVKGLSLSEFYHRPKNLFDPPKFLADSYLYKQLIDKSLKDWQTTVELRDYKNGFSPNSAEFKAVTKNLLEMKNIAEQNGAKFAILIFPEFDPNSPNPSYAHSNFHQSIKHFSQDNGIQVIDPLDSFLEVAEKEKLVINPVDPHPSELAHQLIANTIIDQYDFDQDLHHFKPVNPQVKKSLIKKIGDKLNNFRHVRHIEQDITAEYPVVYFERKNGLNIQSLSPQSLNDRKLIFLEDKLKTVKSSTHPGWPGAVIEHNLEPNGEKIILSNLYGFPVLGIKQFTAFWRDEQKQSEVAEWLFPESVSVNNSKVIITINPQKNYYLYRIEVLVGVNQIDISEDGQVVDITATKNLETELAEDSTRVSFNTKERVGSYPTFLLTQGSSPWAFVNGQMVLGKSAEVADRSFTIEFNQIIKKGSRVSIPFLTAREEPFSIAVEYE